MLSIAERHKYILDSLNRRGFVRITDVANELGVTKVTIRKDVKILESKGLLYKVHGSARPANPHVADLDVHVKDNINREAKRAIARRAVELLRANEGKLHQLAGYLYEHETITGEEFMEILSQSSPELDPLAEQPET